MYSPNMLSLKNKFKDLLILHNSEERKFLKSVIQAMHYKNIKLIDLAFSNSAFFRF